MRSAEARKVPEVGFFDSHKEKGSVVTRLDVGENGVRQAASCVTRPVNQRLQVRLCVWVDRFFCTLIWQRFYGDAYIFGLIS